MKAEPVPSAIPLDLPRVGGGEIQVVLGVDLFVDGSRMVNGVSVATDDELLRLAREAQRKNPETRAVIKADSKVEHGAVIRVLDLLKQAGISKIAFGVRPAPLPPN